MLTLSKVVVEVGNHADAARAGDYRLEAEAAPEAFARTDYQLESEALERRTGRSSSLWLGADGALGQFGVRRGDAIEREQLIAVLQGQHVQSGEQLRRPGALKRQARDEHGQPVLDDEGRPVVERVTGVAHVEMTLSVPKSVSVLWAMADGSDRRVIEDALLMAAERTVQYMARNKAVVHRRGKDGMRIREAAAGAAVASSLHVTARRARGDRAPAPQLHVHNLVIGVTRTDGRLVAADSWEWFRHDAALEGGALFRAQVADALVSAGWAVRSGTGDRGRYFEVNGVPESLCEVMSPRSREVAQARAKVEKELGVRLQGGALAVLAKETRQAKDHDLKPERLRDVWDALGQEHDFGPGSGSQLRRYEPQTDTREAGTVAATRSVVLAQLREQGPTVSLARARALVFEAAAGRLSAEHATRLLAQMECPQGELLTLAGGRITSREIRQLEQHVLDVAVRAAGREDPVGSADASELEAGVAAAEAALGEDKHLDRDQRDAFELLTSGSGWVCLTGRAGTGKGPTLHAAAEAYRAAGWRVLACAMDGTTARRMAAQLGGTAPALTIEQLRVRLRAGAIEVDERTVLFVDEATKLDVGHWAELATCVEHRGGSMRAVGHDGQHDAIRLPGLFAEMLRDPRIPTAELCEIRRHRNPENPEQGHPWLRDYQIAVDEGRGIDAVAILQKHQALRLYDTRAKAMGGMVEEWDEWRRGYPPTETALIIHGPNSDVDLVNELAQRKRLQAGELGEQAIRAVDRDYLLRPGDVVAVRNAAYAFPAQPGQPRPKRVENGQIAIIDSVDPNRDTLTLLLREPGAEPRLVEVDQSRLRVEHAAGKRAAAIRLNYALHSFPAQGATVSGTATLAGHWSQAKQETYVGDTRAIYRHTVHVAREDLGTDGTDEDRMGRYAQRISDNRQRQASIRSALDPTVLLSVHLPEPQPLPTDPTTPRADVARPQATTPTTVTVPACDDAAPPTQAVDDAVHERRARPEDHLDRTPAEPPDYLLRALGPPPEDRVARERWQREAQRLESLPTRPGGLQPAPPASPKRAASPQAPTDPPPASRRIASRTMRP
ncbi:MobF family relaxase [Conexibacter sp. DBS9H8]|uniref:MobF family relaxase n=1 Tax=Conexibacter sp. DBS9H8 TaxID=2937801 RepID=UPI0020102F0B|nr:MobF family relaxase [Conexibacter sp. DBS9H8]